MTSAAPKITTMTAMRARLASDTVKIDQWRYRPGLSKLTTVAEMSQRRSSRTSAEEMLAACHGDQLGPIDDLDLRKSGPRTYTMPGSEAPA